MKNGDLEGTIKNSTNLDFYDAFIITPTSYYRIADLKMGQTAKLGAGVAYANGVQQMISQVFYGNNIMGGSTSVSSPKAYMDQNQETNMMQMLLGNTMGNFEGITMIAFSKTAIHESLLVNGTKAKKNERNIVEIPLNLSFKSGNTIDYPLGFVPYNVINTSSLQFDGVNKFFYGVGTAEISYNLDEKMVPEEIQFNTTNSVVKANGQTKYSIFNITKNIYETLPVGAINKEALGQYLSKSNQVKIKLELNGDQCGVPQMSAKGGTK